MNTTHRAATRFLAAALLAVALLPACGRLNGPAPPGPGAGDGDRPTSTVLPTPGEPVEPSYSPVAPRSTHDARPHVWESIDVGDDDRTLTVNYVGGVDTCYALDRVEVDYGQETVTVTVYEGQVAGLPPDTACIEIGVLKAATVVLDEPLAGRTLVDGAQ